LGNSLLPQKAAYIAWRIRVALAEKSEVQL
jgi:hypothetical protein